MVAHDVRTELSTVELFGIPFKRQTELTTIKWITVIDSGNEDLS
ncbi:hypothetical protein SAMN05216190_14227 [Pseudomonas borbori]|uniref:Uncharacterized protein n=1 Tax=Pseudomonas borbori TaxID=289003 RepID=A0A1I5WQA2_9PSED|nr:hypothetical protein SAMN05216190_14227 [Pseudomonas borbori]